VSNARGRGRFRGIQVDPAHVALPWGRPEAFHRALFVEMDLYFVPLTSQGD
jgi:hypothetical protein